ncbi:MAG: helicase-related protein [Thermomicrobiales bacterium]
MAEIQDRGDQSPGPLRDAYEAAEEFCEEVGKREGIKTPASSRRFSCAGSAARSSFGAGTAREMLGRVQEVGDEDDPGDEPTSSLCPLTDAEATKLTAASRCSTRPTTVIQSTSVSKRFSGSVSGTRFLAGPRLHRLHPVLRLRLLGRRWRLSQRLRDEPIGIYAGSGRSGIFRAGEFTRLDREIIKQQVEDMRLVVGTDAASEGLNLQKLGTLINLDLPWNPTRLEQRKGRIQRIGQAIPEVLIYNMRYLDSVEDRVHELLSGRLEGIHGLFGQIPDTLEDVWVNVALRQEELALETIDEVPEQHPFELKYDRIEDVDWESCAQVLDDHAQLEVLMKVVIPMSTRIHAQLQTRE